MTIDVKESCGDSTRSIHQITNGTSEVASDGLHSGDDCSVLSSIHSMNPNNNDDDGGDDKPVIIITEIDPILNIDNDESDDDIDTEPVHHPIDKGWAWFVMLSCFIMHVLVVGGAKSFGVFLQEFQDRFDVSARDLGFINGMALMLMLGQGLFVNMLANRFSSRRVVMLGSLIISAGFIMSAFIPSFGWLYVTYGLVTGMGLALSFSPTIVMVGQYFHKYRSFAFGIAVSGSGFGSFTIPNLVRVLLKEYGLHGCLLILGAIMLNVSLCGVLLPPAHRFIKKKIDSEKCKNSDEIKQEIVGTDGEYFEKLITESRYDTEAPKERKLCGEMGEIKDNMESVKLDNEVYELAPGSQGRTNDGVYNKHYGQLKVNEPRIISLSFGDISQRTSLKEDTNHTDLTYTQTRKMSKSTNVLNTDISERPTFIERGLIQENRKHHHTSTASLFENFKNRALLMVQNSSNSEKQSTFTYASNCNLAMASQGALGDFSLWTSVNSMNRNNLGEASNSVLSLQNKDKKPDKLSCCRSQSSVLVCSLLSDPMFLLYILSVFLGYTCYINVLFMVPDFAYQSGLSLDMAALCLSVIGIMELVGRITFPPLTDVLPCQRRLVWAAAIGAMGFLNISIPHVAKLETLMAYAALFGYACGAFTSLIPILVTEANGPEKLGTSFGLTTIGMSISVISGPPICGNIKDTTGSWDYGFIFIGVLAIIAMILNFIEFLLRKRREEK